MFKKTVLDPVLNPVSVLKTCSVFLSEIPCPLTCLDFEPENLSLSLFFFKTGCRGQLLPGVKTYIDSRESLRRFLECRVREFDR